MAEKVRVIMIIEMAGRPVEHLKSAMETHLGRLNNQKNVDILKSEISEPKKLEAEEEMYTCFIEVEVEVESFSRLIELVFDFMPSSIEILEPSNLNFNSQEATSFVNTLSGRLHRYDEVTKIAQIRTQQLTNKFREIQEAIEKRKAGKKEMEKSKKNSKKEKKVPKKKK